MTSLKRISVKVIPRAHRDEVVEMLGDVLKVRLRAPPVDGAANEALIKLLSEHFSVKKSRVRIISGQTARLKIVEIC